MGSVLDRYHDKIAGVLSCWDRVVIRGTLVGLCYAGGMTSYLNAQNIRIFDYPRFAQPLRDQVREGAEKLAAKAGVEIEFMRKSSSCRSTTSMRRRKWPMRSTSEGCNGHWTASPSATVPSSGNLPPAITGA